MSTEFEKLKRKLSILEKNKPNNSEGEANLKKIFELFDQDNSGDFNVEEFSTLLQSFGPVPKVEDSSERAEVIFFNAVDLNNSGKIELAEFLTWAQGQSSENTPLNGYRRKLQSPTYQSLLLSRGKSNANNQQYQVNVGVGEFGKAEATARISGDTDAARAKAFRESLGGDKDSLTVSFTLSKKPDRSEFEFGELAGLLRITLLSIQANNLTTKKFKGFKILPAKNGDLQIALHFEKQHRFPIYSITETNWKSISEFLAVVDIAQVEGTLELSQSPAVQRPSEMLAARLSVQAQAQPEKLQKIANFFVEKADSSDDPGLGAFVKTLELAQGLNLNVSLESFQAFMEKVVRDFKAPIYRELKYDQNKSMTYNGFGLVSHILKMGLIQIFKTNKSDEEKTAVLKAIYDHGLKTLKGITSLQVSLDNVTATVQFENLDVFSLFPSPQVAFEEVPEGQPLALNASNDLNIDSAVAKTFTFTSNGDENGAVRWLVQNKKSPKVTASSVTKGKVEDFISTENVMVWTANSPNSWFMIDFGDNCGVKPNHYSVKYSSGGDACCPRNWELQAAEDLNEMGADFTEWTTLSSHKDDMSITSAFQVASFPIKNVSQFFRYFRVIQTGPNAFKKGNNWINVLVMGGFEVYGDYTNQVLGGFDDE